MKRLLSTTASLALCAVSTAALAAPASAVLAPVGGTGDVRIAGTNRYATSVEISEAIARPPQTGVFIASGTVFADALAAGPVAADAGYPILLVGANSVSAEILAEVQRLQPDELIVVGGTAAVSESVATQISDASGGAAVERIEGADRYATGAALAGTFDAVGEVFVVSGEGFADALAAGPAAARKQTGVVLTRKDSLPQASADTLVALAPSQVTIVGGASAVSDAVLGQIKQFLPAATVTRAEGANRYDTAEEVAKQVWPEGAASVYLASGTSFPDALSGTPAAAMNDAPILLTRDACHPVETKAALLALEASLRVHLGGEAATYMGENACGISAPVIPPIQPPSPPPGPDPRSAADVDCGDFSTHAEAQRWFDYWRPIVGDKFRLDRDNDGVACESLP